MSVGRARLRQPARMSLPRPIGPNLNLEPLHLRLCLLAAVCLNLPLHARADPAAQDLSVLARAAEDYAKARTADLPGHKEISVAPLDPRTRLAKCDDPQPFLAPSARLWGSSSVGLRCSSPVAWTVFVPVTVRVFAEVVVTARAVGRGQKLGATDLATQTMDLTQLPVGVMTVVDEAVGRTAIAALPAGAALRADMLRAPNAVLQGQEVRLIYQGEGFQVGSTGRSLSDAAVGQAARVRTASGKVVKGIVQGPGVVEVK